MSRYNERCALDCENEILRTKVKALEKDIDTKVADLVSGHLADERSKWLDKACVWWNLIGIPHSTREDVNVIQEFRKYMEEK